LLGGVAVEAELGGDDDLVADGREGFADEELVGEGAVDFGGVEEGDAAVDGLVEEVDHGGLVFGGSVGEAHAHAAEAEGGDVEGTGGAEGAGLHGVCSVGVEGYCWCSLKAWRARPMALMAEGQPV
jgi:hypothetical protein